MKMIVNNKNIIIIVIMIIVVLDIVMSRPSCGAHTFTEHRHSKFPDLRALILMDTNNDSSVIGGFGGSLMDGELGWIWTQVRLTACISVVVPLGRSLMPLLALPLMEESLYQKVYRLPLLTENFSNITEMLVRNTMIVTMMSGS